MRVDELQAFLEICRHRSIRRAADFLGVTQPSLTKKIQKLEHAFGAPLLHRLPRGVEPTAYGSIVERHARYALGELNHAKDIVHGMRGGHLGTVRIGASIAATHTLMPRVIERIQARDSDAEIQVIEHTVEKLSEELIAGALDLVVAPIPRVGPDRDVESQQLLDDELIVVGGINHPMSKRRSMALAQLLEFPWAFLGENPYKESQLVPLLMQRGLAMPRWIMETNSAGFLISCLSQSTCLALLSRRLTNHFKYSGIKPLRVKDASVPWPIMVSRRKKSIVTPLMNLVISTLTEEIGVR